MKKMKDIVIFNEHYKILFYRNEAQSETEEEEETEQEKRLRLAKKYLQEIEEEGTKFNEIFYV